MCVLWEARVGKRYWKARLQVVGMLKVPLPKLLPEFLGHNGTFPSHDPFFPWAPRVWSHARYIKCSQICALKFLRDELPRVIAVMDNTARY